MPEFRAHNGTRSFSPDDTDRKKYLMAEWPLSVMDIMHAIERSFGKDVPLDGVLIEVEHIQTSCLGHDQYDASDYTNYVVLTLSDDVEIDTQAEEAVPAQSHTPVPKLQSYLEIYCAQEFPYVCEGTKTTREDGSIICSCGQTTLTPEKFEEVLKNSPLARKRK